MEKNHESRKQSLSKESQVLGFYQTVILWQLRHLQLHTNQIWGTSITRSRTTKEAKINPIKTIHKKTFLPSLFGLILPLFLSESSRKSVFSLSDERTLLSMLKNSYQLDFQLESDNSECQVGLARWLKCSSEGWGLCKRFKNCWSSLVLWWSEKFCGGFFKAKVMNQKLFISTPALRGYEKLGNSPTSERAYNQIRWWPSKR